MKDNVLVNIESNIIKDGEDYIFVARELNLICKYVSNNKKIEIIDRIPSDSIFIRRGCVKILKWNNYLIFVPFILSNVCILDIETRVWEIIEIKQTEVPYKFFCAEIYENNLFMFGHYYPAIVKINLINKEILYIEDWIDKTNERAPYLGTEGYREGNFYYITSCFSSRVLKFDMQTCKWEWINIPIENNGFASISCDGKMFWLASRKGRTLIKWDGKNFAEKYEIKAGYEDLNYYSHVLNFEDRIIFISNVTNEIESIENNMIKTRFLKDAAFNCGVFRKKTAYILQENGCIEIFNNGLEDKKTFEWYINRKEVEKYIYKNMGKENLKVRETLNETLLSNIDLLLNVLKSIQQ